MIVGLACRFVMIIGDHPALLRWANQLRGEIDGLENHGGFLIVDSCHVDGSRWQLSCCFLAGGGFILQLE